MIKHVVTFVCYGDDYLNNISKLLAFLGNKDGSISGIFGVEETIEPDPELLEILNRRVQSQRNDQYRSVQSGWFQQNTGDPQRRTQEYQRQVGGPATRNVEKGPRRKTQEYQKQVGSPATRNTEKGPRRKTQEYQRQVDTAARNNEKGPRRKTQEYQRQGERQAVRNTEKGPRRKTQEYNERQGGREAVRNTEKGPGRKTQEYQKQGGRGAVRNTEKGPQRKTQEYQRQGGKGAVRNTEKGPRAQRKTQEYLQRQGEREAVRNKEKGGKEAVRNTEKGPRRITTQEYQRQQSQAPKQDSIRRKPARVYQYGNVHHGKSSQKYTGCVDKGKYCNFWKSVGCCNLPLGTRVCQRTCEFCAPVTLVCPPRYTFGCCWDGMPARDAAKSNCKKCKDLTIACHNRAIYEDCDLHKPNSMKVRLLCPQTCGACLDFL